MSLQESLSIVSAIVGNKLHFATVIADDGLNRNQQYLPIFDHMVGDYVLVPQNMGTQVVVVVNRNAWFWAYQPGQIGKRFRVWPAKTQAQALELFLAHHSSR